MYEGEKGGGGGAGTGGGAGNGAGGAGGGGAMQQGKTDETMDKLLSVIVEHQSRVSRSIISQSIDISVNQSI